MCVWICSWLVSRDKLLRSALRSFTSNPSQLLCLDRLCTFLKGKRLHQDAFHHIKCITITDTKPILSAWPVEKECVCVWICCISPAAINHADRLAHRLRDAGMRGVTPNCHKSTGCSTQKRDITEQLHRQCTWPTGTAYTHRAAEGTCPTQSPEQGTHVSERQDLPKAQLRFECVALRNRPNGLESAAD